jgi:cytochrome c-type biogenesis protein CcmH/NrfG
MRGFRQLSASAVLASALILIPQAVSAQAEGHQQHFIQKTPAQIAAEELAALRQKVRENPKDGNAHFQLAEALRKRDRKREAVQEYVEATTLQPDLWVAYHQLSTIGDDTQQIDDAIARLTKMKAEKPNELMLRVALSELLEKRQNYYQAARVLIEITYANAVPPKYTQRVNGRIHYLLSKSKEAQLSAKHNIPTDEDLDVVPAPLPDTGLRKGLTASKINESKQLKGLGHTPLLP